jgi:hypothetical protein
LLRVLQRKCLFFEQGLERRGLVQSVFRSTQQAIEGKSALLERNYRFSSQQQKNNHAGMPGTFKTR